MKHLIFILALSFSLQTKAQEFTDPSESEELSYDDLVNELSARQRNTQARSIESPFDTIQIHGGMGLINSFSTFEIAGKNASRYQNGMQLSLGVDLFSPNWMAEVAWRNFGLTRDGAEEHTLREFNLKLGYRDRMEGPWSYRLQSGLAQRQLRLRNDLEGYRLSADTPAIMASAAAQVDMSPHASMSFEAGGRAPVVDRTVDKGSLDFAVEFKLSI